MLIRRIRAVLALMIYVLTFFAFGMMNAEPLLAAIEQRERPEEELLIFEVRVNDTLRSRGMIGYLPEGEGLHNTLLPLSTFSRTLSIAMDVNTTDGTAQGWVIEEANTFRLDLSRGVVFVEGEERALEAGEAEAHFEDIYVRASSLQDWLGMTITPDIATLRLLVSSDRKLPFELEADRIKRANAYKKGTSREPIPFTSETMLPYQWWSSPSVVWQNSAELRSRQGDRSARGSFSLQAYGDVAKFDTRFLLSGSTGSQEKAKINNAQLTFEKRDPEANLLGPLNAGKYSIGDVSYPDVPLLVGRKRGRGISVSSDPTLGVSQSLGSETYTVDGDAPLGWDVELYRNGYFVAFQEVDENGRYVFEGVDLTRGFNLFQIILYGPEGQKRTETQRIVRGQELLREGEVSYDFAAGQPEADFLPIADRSRTDNTIGASGRVFYGIRNNLTVGMSAFTGDDPDSDDGRQISAANVTAAISFMGIKTQAQYMQATEGRSGYEISATTQFKGANISADHKVYSGFDAEERDLETVTGADFSRNFGIVSATVRGESRRYISDRPDERMVRGTVSTNIAGVRLSNSMERVYSDSEVYDEFDGDLTVLVEPWDWRLRGNLNYDLDDTVNEKLRNFTLNASHKINRDSTIRVNALYDFPQDYTTTDIRYSRNFDTYSLDFNLGASTREDYYGGVTFRTGLQPDHNGQYQMVRARDAGQGAIGLRTYLDENVNGQYDEGEELLKGVAFRTNRGLLDGKTDENGTLFVNGLSEGITRFILDDSSLPSIYLKPNDDYFDIIPRAGVSTTIDVGFKRLGEIDGFIYMASSEEDGEPRELAGMEVILIDAQSGAEIGSTTSEYDGYYLFSAIDIGAYRVRVIPLWEGEDETRLTADVTLTQDEPIMMDVNIVLPPSEPLAALETDLAASEPAAGHDPSAEVVEAAPPPKPLPVVTDKVDLATDEVLEGLFIHIGSLADFASAQDEQVRLWERHEALLGDTPLYIYKVKVGEKTYFRIVGRVDSSDQAGTLCDALKTQGNPGGCLLMRL